MMLALWSEGIGGRTGALLLAAVLDFALGDPWGWPHPVQAMGWAITQGKRVLWSLKLTPLWERIGGMGLGLAVMGGSGFVGWALVVMAQRLHPVLGLMAEVVLLASCLAGHSLRRAAEEVLDPLEVGDLETARRRLGLYVGRDTEALSEPEILRAVMETISENATDGVMAPLFYALVGSLTPLGPVPFALAYKAASTLDSMVGYREAPYTHLGWFSAQLEDRLTWVPCRLTVITLALLSGRPWRVLALCRRDAPADPSPNAGWSECAYAAALGVQLGGVNTYRGQPKEKPLLGNPDHPITPDRIRRGMTHTRWAFLLWLALGILGVGVVDSV